MVERDDNGGSATEVTHQYLLLWSSKRTSPIRTGGVTSMVICTLYLNVPFWDSFLMPKPCALLCSLHGLPSNFLVTVLFSDILNVYGIDVCKYSVYARGKQI